MESVEAKTEPTEVKEKDDISETLRDMMIASRKRKEFTYSAKIIVDFIEKEGIMFEPTYYPHHTPMYTVHCSGIRISFKEVPDVWFSIQTHPAVTETCFAETLLQQEGVDEKSEDNGGTKIIYKLGKDCIRHETPEALFQYIKEMQEFFVGIQDFYAEFAREES